MAKLVFVHGVNTRTGGGYDKRKKRRHQKFREICFRTEKVEFFEPYWGKFGVPVDEFVTIPDPRRPSPDWLVKERHVSDSRLLVERATVDFVGVVNAIGVRIAESDLSGAEAWSDAIGEMLVSVPEASGEGGEAPGWVAECKTDADLLERLQSEVVRATPSDKQAMLDAKAAIFGGMLPSFLERLIRGLTPAVAVFTGDILCYHHDGSARRNIQEVVTQSIVDAQCSHDPGRLILVGHSLGGVILYDLLTNECVVEQIEAATGKPLQVDLFLGVGTQVGLFREFGTVAPLPDGLIGRDGKVRYWWNVYAPLDALAFRAAPVFPDCHDYQVDIDAGIINAHTAYFSSALFYKKLSRRLEATWSA